VPSHVPPQAVPSLAQAWRPLRGVPVIGVQVPSAPATLQAAQRPPQSTSQQYPSQHWPLAQ
jgi:hypothetical protein